MSDERRRRTVRKAVSFTESEWARVRNRMEMAQASAFDAWARDVVMGAPIRVVTMPFDPQTVRVELSRLGNNVNQIARLANTEDVVTAAELARVRELLTQVQEVLTQAIREGGRS